MDRKPLPSILRFRAERILKKPIVVAYRLEPDNANILELIMVDGSSKFVDLSQGKEVHITKQEQAVTGDLEVSAPVERKERKKKGSTKVTKTVNKTSRKKSTK